MGCEFLPNHDGPDATQSNKPPKRAGVRETVVFVASTVGRLILCPGDDIALALTAGSSANHQLFSHEQTDAVLPRPEMEFKIVDENGEKKRTTL